MNIDEALKILAPSKWAHPGSYVGFEPSDDYVILTVHRGSDSVSRSNWIEAHTIFDVQEYDGGDSGYADRPPVYSWRASHWLVGWVDYLMVRGDAPGDTLIRAAQILDALESYPVLNEDAWGELEMQEAGEAWRNLDLRGRLEVITYPDGALPRGVSLFSIRHDYPPCDDQGYIQERLR
jgi:hypothetical protein